MNPVAQALIQDLVDGRLHDIAMHPTQAQQELSISPMLIYMAALAVKTTGDEHPKELFLELQELYISFAHEQPRIASLMDRVYQWSPSLSPSPNQLRMVDTDIKTKLRQLEEEANAVIATLLEETAKEEVENKGRDNASKKKARSKRKAKAKNTDPRDKIIEQSKNVDEHETPVRVQADPAIQTDGGLLQENPGASGGDEKSAPRVREGSGGTKDDNDNATWKDQPLEAHCSEESTTEAGPTLQNSECNDEAIHHAMDWAVVHTGKAIHAPRTAEESKAKEVQATHLAVGENEDVDPSVHRAAATAGDKDSAALLPRYPKPRSLHDDSSHLGAQNDRGPTTPPITLVLPSGLVRDFPEQLSSIKSHPPPGSVLPGQNSGSKVSELSRQHTDNSELHPGQQNEIVLNLQQQLTRTRHELESTRQKMEDERMAYVTALQKEKTRGDELVQALQLRLYISETRLQTFQEALEEHVKAVEHTMTNVTSSPLRKTTMPLTREGNQAQQSSRSWGSSSSRIVRGALASGIGD